MKKLENKQVWTAEEINEAIKEGYKYSFQMIDSGRIYVSQEMSADDFEEIYADNGLEYNQYQEPSKDMHMGCPIEEAIELFELD